MSVRAGGIGYDELAVISTTRGESLAQVIRLEDQQVSLQVFCRLPGRLEPATGSVSFIARCRCPFSRRIAWDGSSTAPDERATVVVRYSAEMLEIGSPVVNPVKRRMPDKMVETGIPMIDVFNSLVESQKLPIFSVPGEPYNELLARIGLQANADIILLGGMGLRHDDYLKFRHTFDAGGVLGRTIMFIHTAADPVVECLLVPDLCLAVGRAVRVAGQTRAGTLLTDMTAFCRCTEGNLDHHGANSVEPRVSRRFVYASWPSGTRRRSIWRAPVR